MIRIFAAKGYAISDNPCTVMRFKQGKLEYLIPSGYTARIETTLHRNLNIKQTYFSKRIGHDFKTLLINGLLEAKILGTREDSVRFRIRSSKRTITPATTKTTTRLAILHFERRPSRMRKSRENMR